VSSPILSLVVVSLVVWRVTHLFYAEDGPWDILVRLRRLAGNSIFGDLLDCFYCLSLWIAAPLAFFTGANWKERLLLWPALSGAAILLERISDRSGTSIAYHREGEANDVVLRQEPSPTPQASSDNGEAIDHET
jgi:hypothetical protein